MPTSVGIGIFLVLYALVLLVLFPLLRPDAVPQYAPRHYHAVQLRRGEVLQPVVQPLVERVKHLPHLPGQLVAEDLAGVVKQKFHQFRQDQGVTDAHLLDRAVQDFEQMRVKRSEQQQKQQQQLAAAVAAPLTGIVAPAPGKRTGFMVLGMHRSGTSMLSGLMVTGLGYKPGGPLIGGAFDNEKGFFERIDVVYQNDEFMNKQNVWWSANVVNYNPDTALRMMKDGRVKFDNGKKALQFFSNPEKAPWLQKDPRMCITLKTWLPLLDAEPAIVFTYRHPLEVANSLKHREQGFTIEHGLRLWLHYNKAALTNSQGLCRVLSSNEAILENPLHEVQRIANELTTKCGVPAPPKGTLQQEDVDRFVDPNLQHNKKEAHPKKVIASYYGTCEVPEYKSEFKPPSMDYQREHDMYMVAMKLYCALKSGDAYKESFEWPAVPQ